MEFEEQHRRHTPEPDLVPIVDSLVSVIFFLLFSTTFIELTQMTVPPAVVSSSATKSEAPPVSPRFFMDFKGEQLQLTLKWKGEKPGSVSRKVARSQDFKPSLDLENAVEEMTKEFTQQYTQEKTVQVSLFSEASYQELINVMDGLKRNFPDLVLISYEETKNKDVL